MITIESQMKVMALKQAKALLDSGAERFICVALMTVKHGDYPTDAMWDACESLIALILRSVMPSGTLIGYVEWEGYKVKSKGYTILARMAWIDKMIYNLENAT